MSRLRLRNNILKFKTIMKITKKFRGLYGIYLKLMKENQNITTCDWLGLQTPQGSRPIMDAEKSLWTLDAGHVNNLNEGKFLYWLRFNWINWDFIGITTGSYNVLKLNVELHSKLTATPFMVFIVPLYNHILALHKIITSYDKFRYYGRYKT